MEIEIETEREIWLNLSMSVNSGHILANSRILISNKSFKHVPYVHIYTYVFLS